MPRSGIGWRVAFGVSAATLLAGGPLHPDGTMAEMLAHPDWFLSHVLQVVSYAAMAVGLWMFGAGATLPPSTHRWLRLAIAGTILQTIEMVFHTWAGRSRPPRRRRADADSDHASDAGRRRVSDLRHHGYRLRPCRCP